MSETQPKRYRIVKLSASNIKRIKAVEILPNGNIITVGGRNDQGKSSLLDSIAYACAGGATCEQPIRQGASKAEVIVDLGDMVITKTFATNSSPTLKIKMKDGTPVKTPQGILDALCSKISYDPMEFQRDKPDKQLETLRKLTGLDFTELNGRRQKAYDERTNTNRSLDQKKANLATMPVHADAPASEVSVKELMDQMTALRKRNEEKEKVHDASNSALNAYSSKQIQVVNSGAEMQRLSDELKKKTEAHNVIAAELRDLEKKKQSAFEAAAAVVMEDEQPITDQINSADQTNSKVRENASRKTLEGEVATLTKTSDEYTTRIEDIDADKENLLKSAKFPLPGLSFDDSGVLLNGVPFAQAGMAAKMKASVAIGLTLNPKLRVILVRDGSLLDDESMAVLAQIAEEQDAQIWVEVCHNLDKASVVIEDGMLVEK